MIKRRGRGSEDSIYWSDDKGNIYQLIGGNWVKLDKGQEIQLLTGLMIISGNDFDKIRADLRSPNIIEYKSQAEKELEYFEALRNPNRPFWQPPPTPPAGLGCSVYLVYLVICSFWAFLMFLVLKLIGDIMFK
jgi:hypothetical protein